MKLVTHNKDSVRIGSHVAFSGTGCDVYADVCTGNKNAATLARATALKAIFTNRVPNPFNSVKRLAAFLLVLCAFRTVFSGQTTFTESSGFPGNGRVSQSRSSTKDTSNFQVLPTMPPSDAEIPTTQVTLGQLGTRECSFPLRCASSTYRSARSTELLLGRTNLLDHADVRKAAFLEMREYDHALPLVHLLHGNQTWISKPALSPGGTEAS